MWEIKGLRKADRGRGEREEKSKKEV